MTGDDFQKSVHTDINFNRFLLSYFLNRNGIDQSFSPSLHLIMAHTIKHFPATVDPHDILQYITADGAAVIE